MNIKTISISILFSMMSATAMANSIPNPYNDEAFNPDGKISLTENETKEVQERLDQDKAVAERLKQENSRRDSVIKKCSELLDNSYSPESVEKTRLCLQSNNGFFPQEFQIQNAQPLDAMNRPINNQRPTTRPALPVQPTPVQNNNVQQPVKEAQQPKAEKKEFNAVRDIFN